MMATIINAPTRLKITGAVLAMAALLIALLAVVMTAGPTMAQGLGPDPDELPRTGENSEQYDKPYPCYEEAEPAANTRKVIDSGHYPVFDAFWDYEVGHLSNNFCPPEVEHIPGNLDALLPTPPQNTRTDANIHISETVFSIPDRYKVTVIDSDETNGNPSPSPEPNIDLANYPFLRDVVSAVKPGPDSTPENPTWVFADNKLWWVKAENVPANTDANTPLILGFSTDLLKEADWYLQDGPDADTDPEPPVLFEFVAVHVLKDGSPQEAHVVGAHFFAFDPGASQTTPQWSNVTTATESEIHMFTGKYRHMQYVFTDPGQYLVQVHVKGHVRNTIDPAPAGGHDEDWSQISPDESITSPAEWYTFHVGPEDDLSVTLAHTDETPDDDTTTISDSTASFTVTATNVGPEDAMDAVVQVRLPKGLTYQAGSARIGSATTEPPFQRLQLRVRRHLLAVGTLRPLWRPGRRRDPHRHPGHPDFHGRRGEQPGPGRAADGHGRDSQHRPAGGGLGPRQRHFHGHRAAVQHYRPASLLPGCDARNSGARWGRDPRRQPSGRRQPAEFSKRITLHHTFPLPRKPRSALASPKRAVKKKARPKVERPREPVVQDRPTDKETAKQPRAKQTPEQRQEYERARNQTPERREYNRRYAQEQRQKAKQLGK